MHRSSIIKNKVTGLIIEVLNPGSACGCCSPDAVLMTENTVEASLEKHIPVLTGDEKGIHVKVGAVEHPMTPEHYIEFIEVINGDYVNRRYLKAGEKPEACFYVPNQPGLIVRAYCNLHGLWKA